MADKTYTINVTDEDIRAIIPDATDDECEEIFRAVSDFFDDEFYETVLQAACSIANKED